MHSHETLGDLVSLVLDENYVGVRVRELYNIIAEYPESTCAILELRSALSRTQQHHLLALSLRSTLEHRLLHAGANTSQIIDMYISTIRVLRVLDPYDLILDTATCPVRQYLQNRKDTVRCIVANLTDDISGELYEELNLTSAAEQSFMKEQYDEDQFAGPGNDDWVPKSNKPHGMTVRSMRDILAMLISIYGTTEIFVNEYRVMLADKLLAKLELEDTTQELKYLELLKFRFGEAALHHCEIMLRDVEDSKRLNKRIDGGFVQATIISQVFWPVLPDSTVTLHPRVKSVLSSFEQMYDSLKTPRRLVWKKETGMAQLEIDLGPGGKKVFTVSVVHANIILHFHGCDTRTLNDLTIATRMPRMLVQNRVAFWISHGIIEEKSCGLFSVTSKFQNSNSITLLDEITQHTESCYQQSLSSCTELFYPYIIVALKNLGKLTLTRLHTVLQLCLDKHKPKCFISPRELARILDQLCTAEKVQYSCGSYEIPTPLQNPTKQDSHIQERR
jgi:anaphase-promoting complex subunit 2